MRTLAAGTAAEPSSPVSAGSARNLFGSFTQGRPVTAFSTDPLVAVRRARRALDNGRYEEALEECSRELVLDRNAVGGLHMRALVLGEMGRMEARFKTTTAPLRAGRG